MHATRGSRLVGPVLPDQLPVGSDPHPPLERLEEPTLPDQRRIAAVGDQGLQLPRSHASRRRTPRPAARSRTTPVDRIGRHLRVGRAVPVAGARLLGQRCEHAPQDQVTGQAGSENGEVLLGERELELADVIATVDVDAHDELELIALADDLGNPASLLDGVHDLSHGTSLLGGEGPQPARYSPPWQQDRATRTSSASTPVAVTPGSAASAWTARRSRVLSVAAAVPITTTTPNATCPPRCCAVFEQGDLEPADAVGMAAGMAAIHRVGSDRGSGVNDWAERYLSLPSLTCPRTIVNDAVTAHRGALLGRPGVIVVAGTGSMILAITEDGRQVESGQLQHYAGGARHLVLGTLQLILTDDADTGRRPVPGRGPEPTGTSTTPPSCASAS